MKPFLIPLCVLILASLAVVTAWHLLGGSMAGSLMGHCPLGQDSVTCLMSVSEHLGAWQALFAATVSVGISLLALAAASLPAFFSFASPPATSPGDVVFFKHTPSVPAPGGIAHALARGIIHPKLFAPAVR